MRVLVLGSGSREHALAWKLARDPAVRTLVVAPGNPGTALHGERAPLDLNALPAIVDYVRNKRMDFVIVGPEAPLVAGVADAIRAIGVPVFGPSGAAAAIEGSKAFAKEIMQHAGVPTARATIYTDAKAAAAALRGRPERIVVKADGLAAGKGVIIANSGDEAAQACVSLGALPAGRTLLVEEFLDGVELSVIALCDGERYTCLPAAQDHKRVGDNDTGPNTGGMGAYAPVPLATPALLAEVGERVIAPVLRELARRGTPFVGALYAGLMLTADGIRVLEFNCRLGDPETQPLMMLLDEPLGELFLECAEGKLRPRQLRIRPGAAVGVVLAAANYPETPRLGDAIVGTLPAEDDLVFFHGGTTQSAKGLVTAGGRVGTVCAYAPTFAQARERAYRAIEGIRFEGCHFRRDIGARDTGAQG